MGGVPTAVATLVYGPGPAVAPASHVIASPADSELSGQLIVWPVDSYTGSQEVLIDFDG